MGRIGYCEVCGVTEQRRAAEIYDGVDNAPDACWQCERALKFEQERIIKLLKTDAENQTKYCKPLEAEHCGSCFETVRLISLIKGDNE